MKFKDLFTKRRITALWMSLIAIIFFGSLNLFSEDTLCFKQKISDAQSFGIYTGWNDANNPIVWDHSIPAGILDSVVRVGLYIEAWDVDYPGNDEHDRIFFNGYDLGVLEGFNNTWITVEKTIPASYIKEGINTISIGVDELHKGWKVTIRSSELRFYCSTPDPDFSIGVSPSNLEIIPGGSVSTTVSLISLNNFNSPVTLTTSGFPQGISEVFSKNPMTPTGQSVLTLKSDLSAKPGIYKVKIVGSGGGKNKNCNLILEIKERKCPEFRIDYNAKPMSGNVPLTVKFKSLILTETENSEVYIYDWDFDDGGVSSQKDPEHVFYKAGKFKVKLTVTNSCGISKDLIQKIDVVDADIKLKKTVNRSSAKPGEELIYNLILKNNSKLTLNSIKVEDKFPEEVRFISQNSDLKFIINGNSAKWTGSLSPDSEKRIEIHVKIGINIKNDCKIENNATLSDESLHATVKSNIVVTEIATEPVNTSKIKFLKRTESHQTNVGKIVIFRLSIRNNSQGILFTPVAEDHLPQGFSYVPGSTLINGLKQNDPSGKRTIFWNLDNIFPGENIVIRFSTVIGSDVKRGKNINRAFFRTTDSAGQNIILDASDFINVSISGYIFYSGIEGTVYIERNGDDFYGGNDTPVEGVEVVISSGEKSTTNSNGFYSFKNLFPGEYALGVNRISLPEKYKLINPYSVPVVLSDGLTDTHDFALRFAQQDIKRSSKIIGRVFYDKDKDGEYSGKDLLVKKFKAIIDGKLSMSGSQGVFIFTHLTPGKHTLEIKLEQKSVYKSLELKAGVHRKDIPIQYSGIRIIIRGKNEN